MTVQQLYPYDVRTLSAFVCACSDGDSSVTGTPLMEAWTRTLVLSITHICIRCDVLEKDEDMVGRTRDQRRVCGGAGQRECLSL
jgi:hypothetical protein